MSQSSPASSEDIIEETADEPIDHAKSAEWERLAAHPPFRTLLTLSAGPLISQIAGSLYGIVNGIWVAKYVGDAGLTAMSMYNNFDTISRAFGFFLQVAASAKISALCGAGQKEEAGRVFADLLRFAFLCAVIAPCGFLPWCRDAIRFFGASEKIVNMGYDYIFPNMASSVVPCVFLFGCGCLQAEGRSWVFAAVQVTAMASNMFVWAPFFLIVCKCGIASVSYSTICAELFPAIVVLILFFAGKMTIRPKFGDLLKRPSPHTWSALKIGFSQFVLQISLAVPGLLVRYYFGRSAKSEQEFDDVMAGFNALCRVWTFVNCVSNALAVGYIPGASFALGAKLYSRITRLQLHMIWMSMCWSLLSLIATVGLPRQVCSIFSTSPGYLEWGTIVMRRGFALSFLGPIPIAATAMLQSMQMGGTASLLMFLAQSLPLPAASTILYFTNKHDIGRLMWSYPLQNLMGTTIAIPFAIMVVRKLYKLMAEHRSAELETTEDNDNIQDSLINKRQSDDVSI